MAELDDTLRLIQGNAKAQDTAFAAAIATPQQLSRTLVLTFEGGDRVLDLVTGQEGTVTGGNRQNTVLAVAANEVS